MNRLHSANAVLYQKRFMLFIIIITKICKAPTLQFKALNKHSVTHTENVYMKNKN